MAPRRARRRPSGVNRRMLSQRQKLQMQRNPLLQGPRNPPVQGPALRIPGGLMGSRPPAPPASARPAPGPDIWNPGSYRGGSSATAQAGQAAAVARNSGGILSMLGMPAALGALLGVGSSMAFPGSGGRGTLTDAIKRGDYRPMQGPPAPKAKPAPKPQTQKLSASAKSFDKAFAKARAAGLQEFTWRGRRYNTRYAGE